MKKTGGAEKAPPFKWYKLVLNTETLLEAVNTSAGVNNLLLAGEKRMALGADFNADFLGGGTCFDHVAASTLNGSGLVLGMQIFSHL